MDRKGLGGCPRRIRLSTNPEGRGAVRLATFEWMLSNPWGRGALIAVGAGVIGSALYQLYQAVSGRLRERLSMRSLGRRATAITNKVARVGLAARGAVFGIVGYFLIRAALERDASEFHEVGGALRLLGSTPLGPWVMGIVALGLVAFALYMAMLALFRRGTGGKIVRPSTCEVLR